MAKFVSKKNSFQNPNNQTIPGYDYGTIPSLPVAEQTQTYMAYFDGVGGTGPEILGQTGYFVKYLIDEDGNVSKPADVGDPTSPSQVPLYNLNTNFEAGKNAIVKLIEYDPTIAGSATGQALTGKHKITGVGETYPILVSEYGPNADDFYHWLDFGPTTVYATQSVLDLNAIWFNGDVNYTQPVTEAFFDDWQDFRVPINAFNPGGGAPIQPNFPSQSANWSSATYNKTIQKSTTEAGTQIAVKFALNIVNNTNNPNYAVQFRLLKNKPTLGTGSVLYTSDIFSLTTTPYYPNPYVLLNTTPQGGSFDNVYTGDTQFFDLNDNDVLTGQIKFYRPTTFASPYETYTDGDIYLTGAHSSTFLRVFQQYPVTVSGSVEYIGGENRLLWSFFVIDNPTYASGSYSVLDMSLDALYLYYSGQTQNYNNQTLNYNQFVIPFGDLKVGDTLRLGYDKENTHTIVGIYPKYRGLSLMISPQVSNLIISKTQLFYTPVNNFSITRLVPNGRYIVLDVDKPRDGVFFSGIIQPEFASERLQKNYDKIIRDLTEKELIN